jgi:RNA polymerase sigma factor (sigma-70 family)
VVRALQNGAYAASCSVYEREGRVELTTRTDRDAFAIVEYVAPGETNGQGSRCSLGAALALAAGGAQITSISSPDSDALVWTAVAMLDARWKLPHVPVMLRPIVPGQVWRVVCRDYRGLSAMFYSKLSTPRGRPLGEALSSAMTRTRIDGAAARMRAARPPREDLPTFVAGAAAEVFRSPDATSGSDGGLALIEWAIARRDLTAVDAWNTVAESVVASDRPAKNRRRDRLFDKVLRVIEIDAFGSRADARRSGTIIPLDPSAEESEDDDPTLADPLVWDPDIAPSVLAGLEINDLLAAARLSNREREVFELLRADLTQLEIAERLGVARGTVAAWSSRLKKKLRQARDSM